MGGSSLLGTELPCPRHNIRSKPGQSDRANHVPDLTYGLNLVRVTELGATGEAQVPRARAETQATKRLPNSSPISESEINGGLDREAE